MKTIHTAESLAEMIILSTFIADTVMSTENQNKRQKDSITRVDGARQKILKKITDEENSDEDIYDATESVFNKYYTNLSKKDFLFLCRGFLGVYLRNYQFNDAFYNLFKDVHRYSGDFARGGKSLKNANIDFINAIRKCTRPTKQA